MALADGNHENTLALHHPSHMQSKRILELSDSLNRDDDLIGKLFFV